MSVVELIPLDKGHRLILDNSVVTTVGRTPNIGCLDKKISRNHAEFHIKPDGTAWIKPIHHNPTFLRTKTSQLITLTKDEEFQLHDNDEIGLLPTEYFYRISIKRPDDPTPEERIEEKPSSPPPQNQPFSPAKDHDDPNVEPEGGVILHTTRALPAWMSGSSVVEPKPSKGKGKQSASTTPTKTPSPNKCRTYIGRKKAEGLTYEDDEEPEEEASTTPPRANRDNPSKRERCPYGKFCYRKNPQHRQQAIHPGDPDWSDKENTTDGSKPVCPYGSDCYRKNPDHFNEYDHTQKATATNKPKQRTSKRKGSDDEDDDDDGLPNEYDYQDSFIDDEDLHDSVRVDRAGSDLADPDNDWKPHRLARAANDDDDDDSTDDSELELLRQEASEFIQNASTHNPRSAKKKARLHLKDDNN